MKLVFYGGGFYDLNHGINEKALLLTAKESPLITYIPSYSYGAEEDFWEFIGGFKSFELTRFLYLPVDQRPDNTLLKEVLTSDMIHLSGGDTFYFLKYLKKSGIFYSLKTFVRRGGTLTGLSAGGIIMGPSIAPASYPEFDCDENSEEIINWTGLSLSRFDFFPHYKNSYRYERELLEQSLKTSRMILAAPDYSGIVINGEDIEFLGRIYCFHDGIKSIYH